MAPRGWAYTGAAFGRASPVEVYAAGSRRAGFGLLFKVGRGEPPGPPPVSDLLGVVNKYSSEAPLGLKLEKGFQSEKAVLKKGQSVLRVGEIRFPNEGVLPKKQTHVVFFSLPGRKGNGGLKFPPNPGHGEGAFGTKCGNATEPETFDGGPRGKRVFFSCKSSGPRNRLSRGIRGGCFRKKTPSLSVSGAPCWPL
ncbi:hypothetical protein JTE90_009294 [Oedothorax gibbosus]|uniref:Uncharacterized protein n=1 Tax=Oedothorax gibbosus TaxID=931172 RepID=A0AAV6TF22_9ARAC|nr:hypothetical protein JTE90_009294 [Oedothorax gibbosus]